MQFKNILFPTLNTKDKWNICDIYYITLYQWKIEKKPRYILKKKNG